MKRVAIIGTGIAGLSTAFHLHDKYHVTLFDRNTKPGGHTDTHSFVIDGKETRIDSGFIIFCPEFYPNFCAMLDKLGVASKVTDMSFSAHNRKTGLVYNATSINKLFCQRRNLFSPKFYRMLFDLVRFYSTSTRVLKSDDTSKTVKQYLVEKRYGDGFINDHLLPMISALWSATPERVELFPIRHLVEFFRNHGLLKLVNRPDWRVVENGSASYVEALEAHLDCTWRLGQAVTSVSRDDEGVTIETTGSQEAENFDAVVFACHSDQIMQMLESSSTTEKSILEAMPFEKNHVVVHTDEGIMHPNKSSWASWNTEVPNEFDPVTQRCCTANYWMNSLQRLDLQTNVFTSLNGSTRIDPELILAERQYSHPVFTATSVAAQKKKPLIDGENRSYFVGSYWGWGFHEDGARTAKQVSDLIHEQLK